VEKYGFIYIWRDKKRNKFYIGCHWGTEADGYICSSKRMRNAYAYRKEDFKRRVVQRVYTNRQDLLEVEHLWLSLIPDEQLGKRYYNLNKHHFGHWTADPEKAPKIKEKLTGRKHEQNAREKMSKSKVGRFWINNGETTKSIASTDAIPDGWLRGRLPSKLKGVPRSPEVLAKIHASRSVSGWGHSAESRKKLAVSHQGKQLSDSHKASISASIKNKPSNNPMGRSAK